MSRPYPKILRTTEAADATLRTYARKAHLAPFEALILAIGLLRTRDEREAASERAYKFAALWHDLARKLWHRWRSAKWAIQRVTRELCAERKAHTATRADLESAREATRRADAEVEGLQRELASLRGGLDLATETIVRVLHERDAALSELAEVRAALTAKGATDRLAERVETIAADVPDDFEAKIAERAPGWKGTADELRARVITLGFSRYDALATDAAKRAAERGR